MCINAEYMGGSIDCPPPMEPRDLKVPVVQFAGQKIMWLQLIVTKLWRAKTHTWLIHIQMPHPPVHQRNASHHSACLARKLDTCWGVAVAPVCQGDFEAEVVRRVNPNSERIVEESEL